jgi:hypothetical protein
VSRGYTASIDPEAWKIVDGKLYLNYSREVQKDVGGGCSGPYTAGERELAPFDQTLILQEVKAGHL